jgi:ribosomal protein RSM22 (predicted rRNA methylase)
VPKGAAAVRELVASGVLPVDRPLKVLDVGAGLGATTWGLARALRAAGSRQPIEATWVEPDAAALQVGRALLEARGPCADAVEIRMRAAELSPGLGRFDVVLLGQVLSEMDVAADDARRLAEHLRLVLALLEDRLLPGGAVVIVEPALRDRSRHLHRLRDAVAAAGKSIFAPCLHTAPCPALIRDSDWCHEDLAVDLPAWLAPVARAAGLRREGLTFSYIVIREGGSRLVDALRSPRATTDGLGAAAGAADGLVAAAGAADARLRVVSDAIRTKGKHEIFVCGAFPNSGGSAVARVRLTLLDRDTRETNAAWLELRRGDVAIVSPPPDLERPRIGSAGSVLKAIVVSSGSQDAESR